VNNVLVVCVATEGKTPMKEGGRELYKPLRQGESLRDFQGGVQLKKEAR
jgi:hypothetical protein